MVRTLPFHGRNFGSTPCGATNGDVAQLVEHMPEEHGVVSSILTVTTNDLLAQW